MPSDQPVDTWYGVRVEDDRVIELELENWGLAGQLPPEIGGLSALRALKLGRNLLGGEIPTEIGGLSSVEIIWMSDNEFTGSIPPEIGDLSNLRQLILGRKQADRGDTR